MTAPAKCAKTEKSRNGWIWRSESSKVRQDCSHGLPVWSAAANIFSHKRLQSSCQRDADAAKRDKENLLLMETLKCETKITETKGFTRSVCFWGNQWLTWNQICEAETASSCPLNCTLAGLGLVASVAFIRAEQADQVCSDLKVGDKKQQQQTAQILSFAVMPCFIYSNPNLKFYDINLLLSLKAASTPNPHYMLSICVHILCFFSWGS